jgi:hypothetical protein
VWLLYAPGKALVLVPKRREESYEKSAGAVEKEALEESLHNISYQTLQQITIFASTQNRIGPLDELRWFFRALARSGLVGKE